MQQLLSEGIGWDEMLYLNFEDERSLLVTESKATVLRLFSEYFHEGGFPVQALFC